MKKYIEAKGKLFCKGQEVRILLPGEWLGKRGIVNCHQSLSNFYELTGRIPVTNITDIGEFSVEPEYLQILTLKKAKGGGNSMPRIFKWILYLTLVLAVWKLTFPSIDLFLKFITHWVTK